MSIYKQGVGSDRENRVGELASKSNLLVAALVVAALTFGAIQTSNNNLRRNPYGPRRE